MGDVSPFFQTHLGLEGAAAPAPGATTIGNFAQWCVRQPSRSNWRSAGARANWCWNPDRCHSHFVYAGRIIRDKPSCDSAVWIGSSASNPVGVRSKHRWQKR